MSQLRDYILYSGGEEWNWLTTSEPIVSLYMDHCYCQYCLYAFAWLLLLLDISLTYPKISQKFNQKFSRAWWVNWTLGKCNLIRVYRKVGNPWKSWYLVELNKIQMLSLKKKHPHLFRLNSFQNSNFFSSKPERLHNLTALWGAEYMGIP